MLKVSQVGSLEPQDRQVGSRASVAERQETADNGK